MKMANETGSMPGSRGMPQKEYQQESIPASQVSVVITEKQGKSQPYKTSRGSVSQSIMKSLTSRPLQL